MENLKQSNLKLLPFSTVSAAIEEMYTLFLEQPWLSIDFKFCLIYSSDRDSSTVEFRQGVYLHGVWCFKITNVCLFLILCIYISSFHYSTNPPESGVVHFSNFINMWFFSANLLILTWLKICFFRSTHWSNSSPTEVGNRASIKLTLNYVNFNHFEDGAWCIAWPLK